MPRSATGADPRRDEACAGRGFSINKDANSAPAQALPPTRTNSPMSTRQDKAPSPPVGSRDELVAWIAAGSKPREQWRIGTEHEKFLFHIDTLKPVPYEGPRGVRALMQGLIDRFGWLPIMEGDNIIALKRPDGEAGRHRVAGARRPVRAVGRSARDRARGRRRDARAPEPMSAPPARRWASASSASASRRTGRSTRCRACPSSATT